MPEIAEDQYYERFGSVVGDAIAHAANESIVLARLAEFFSPSRLAGTAVARTGGYGELNE